MTLPSSIGGYEIQRVLGSGGMATVYAALQKQPRRTVAVKVMRHASADATMLRRFHREVEILGRLRHPFIGQVYGAGVHEEGGIKLPYFVMEYVPGARTITEYCEERTLSLRERIKLFVKVCAGVEHGHRQKVIHRDLKPGNVLVDEQGEPKIIDYGVARFSETEVHDARTVQTEPGRLTGTIQYMAPEQIESAEHDLDARCDVYALGVILYKLLTARHPYELTGLTLFAAARVISEQVPPAPSSLEPRIGRDLETIVLKALAKDRRNRYGSAGSLGRDLLRWLTHKPINARRVSSWWRLMLFMRRHRTETVAVAIVAVVIGLAFLGLAVQRQQLARSMGQELEFARRDRAASVLDGEEGDPSRAASEGGAAATSPDDAILPPSPQLSTPRAARSARLLVQLGEPVREIHAASDVETIVVITENGGAHVVDVRRARVLFRSDPQRSVLHARFVQGGTGLVTVDTDGRIEWMDARTGESLGSIAGSVETCLAAAVHPSGELVVLAGDDLTLRLVTLTEQSVSLVRSSRGAYEHVAISDDHTSVYALTAYGEVDRWRLAGDEWRVDALPGRFPGEVYGLACTGEPDALMVVTGQELWWGEGAAPADPKRRTSLGAYDTPPVMSMQAPRGLLAIRYERQVHVLDARSGYMAGDPIERPDGRSPAAFAFFVAPDGVPPDDLWLIVADESGTLLQLPILLDR